MKSKVSDIVFDFISDLGIDTVFTISGGGCMHLTDSLGKNKKLKYICNHHEQACAISAEAYARTKQKPGCILVTTGPGGTNTLTGVLCAFQDSIPMIIISGQVPTNQLSKDTGCRQIGQQEFNIVDTVKSMTKYSTLIENSKSIIYELEKAYHMATSGRPGPVWIDIPLDIQSSYVDTDDLIHYELPLYYITETNYTNSLYLSALKAELNKSKKPVVVIGGGIKASQTTEELKKFLKQTGLPVMSGPHSAVDIINNDYIYYAGRFGLLGQKSSNNLIQESDLVISLGSRLNPKMIGYDSLKFAPLANKFVIDVDKNELRKLNFSNTTYKWNVDLKVFFNLISDIKKPDIQCWQNHILDMRSQESLVLDKHRALKKYVSSYVLVEKLQKYLKNDSIIVTSDGTAHVVPLKTIQLRSEQQLFSNEGTAPMGYGLPAAIGAYYGSNKPIICIEGDGSVMMNLQELETVKYHNMPIKIFVLNNQGYLSIRLTQNSFFNGHLVATDHQSGVSIPAFKDLAKCFKYKYFSIKNNKQIDSVLTKVFKDPTRCIVEIFSDPNELHEPKVKAKGIDINGKIIPGELTNIS
jgi:acetolactate synthase-1/2/3 large subunit